MDNGKFFLPSPHTHTQGLGIL